MPLFSCVLSYEFFCVKSAEDFEMAYLGWTMPRAYHDLHLARYTLECGGLAAAFSVATTPTTSQRARLDDKGAGVLAVRQCPRHNFVCAFAQSYSCRSATIGSTRIALRAGTYPAIAATAARPNATAPSVAGS